MTENTTLEQRLQALQEARAVTSPPEAAPIPAAPVTPANTNPATTRPTATRAKARPGPAPARIVAAAASVAAGIGLVTLMAGAQQDIVVQVNPTPITVQPASIVVEMQPGDGAAPTQVEVRTVEAAVPAERPAPQAKVVTQSEGS